MSAISSASQQQAHQSQQQQQQQAVTSSQPVSAAVGSTATVSTPTQQLKIVPESAEVRICNTYEKRSLLVRWVESSGCHFSKIEILDDSLKF